MIEFDVIHTERMLLRKLTPALLEYIYREKSAAEQMEFLGLDTLEQLEKEKAKYEKGLCTHNRQFLYFHLLLKSDNALIGWCGYHTWYTDHDRAEIGYEIFDQKYRGMKLMSEAIKPIIEYGFGDMNLNRIEAFIGTQNQASLKLATGMGFIKEGTLREHYRKGNRIEDSVVFGLLKDEYKGIHGASG